MKNIFLAALLSLLLIAFSACTNTADILSAGSTSAEAPTDLTKSSDIESKFDSGTEKIDDKESTSLSAAETDSPIIARERAIEIALQAAGLTKETVYDLDAEIERDRGLILWEIDFETAEYEFSYHIDAENGSVIRSEKEIND